MRRFLLLLVMTAPIASVNTPSLLAQTFQDIGSLGLPNAFLATEVFGISADGQTFVGSIPHPNPVVFGAEAAFYWTPETGVTVIPDGGLFRSYAAMDVSADGKTILIAGITGIVNGESVRGYYLWTKEKGLEVVDLPLTFRSSIGRGGGFDMSSDGGTIVGTTPDEDDAFTDRAYQWSKSTGTRFLADAAGLSSAEAFDVSAGGAVVVGYGSEAGDVATSAVIAWRAGTPLRLPMPTGTEVIRFAVVSNNGVAISGTYLDGQTGRLFRWTQETGTVTLEHPPVQPVGTGLATIPGGITKDGSVIVGKTQQATDPMDTGCNGGPVAFLWTSDKGTRSLKTALIEDHGFDIADWCVQTADHISADGRVIMGYAIDPDGQFVMYRAELKLDTEIIVNDTRDLPDSNPADDICDVDASADENQCTLRAAIQTANRR
ncbi:MAG: hypothetical protein ACC628_26180, partial [Pirellulaceae bacterium]